MKQDHFPAATERIVKKETVRCTVKSFTGSSILIYRLIRCRDRERDQNDLPFETEYYSISIIRLGDDNTRDEKLLRDVARAQEEAFSLFELLARNTVTPETADEIMDDYIGV